MIEFEQRGAQFTLEFKIEQLPDGSFVGRSEKPKIEVKGATPQEVQEKIREMTTSGIMKRLGFDFSTTMSGPGIQVTLHQHAPGETPRVQVGGQMPLTGEPFDASSFRVQGVLKLLAIAGLLGLAAWWFFRG